MKYTTFCRGIIWDCLASVKEKKRKKEKKRGKERKKEKVNK